MKAVSIVNLLCTNHFILDTNNVSLKCVLVFVQIHRWGNKLRGGHVHGTENESCLTPELMCGLEHHPTLPHSLQLVEVWHLFTFFWNGRWCHHPPLLLTIASISLIFAGSYCLEGKLVILNLEQEIISLKGKNQYVFVR